MRRTGKVIGCINCGALKYVRGSHVKRGARFCAIKCRDEFKKRPETTCPVCNVKFLPKNRKQQTCSYRCSKTKERNPLWKGGVCKRPITAQHKEWRKKVFERDKYTCQCCKLKIRTLHAHHIKPYANHPSLRFEVSNGKTLCVECHKKTDSYGAKFHKQSNC